MCRYNDGECSPQPRPNRGKPMSQVAAHPLLVLVAGVVWLGGCVHAQRPAPIAPSASRDEPTPAQSPTPPERVTLFGDHPDRERTPVENRLLTNLTQHTFASVGRDFDPDIRADGSLLVFASTRNSEHADIFYKKPDGYAITQLVSDPADDIQPRFSPSGDEVVFCSNRSGNWDIWKIRIDGTELVQLTQDRADEVAPCWSPDGKQIAFTVWGQRSRQWEIWVMSADSPGLRRFLAYGMFPDWSPDGRRIAFQRARQRGTRWFSVWTIELVDDEARHPTEIAYADDAACIAPRFSPDGNALTYCTVASTGVSPATADSRTANADLWIVDLASGLRMKLTDGAAPAFNPTWASSGRIFFVSAHRSAENIWSLDSRIGGPATARGPAPQPVLTRAAAGPPDPPVIAGPPAPTTEN
ncbi:MAG: hypothetical protein D6744_15620 [Planctomycetota bacterium]|nr:MAG: hypothetical protein D6744_15620 [Planctomycetota bacterium]